MTSHRIRSAAAAAGLLSVLLGLVGTLVDRMWTFPATRAGTVQVAEFVHAHHDRLVAAMCCNTIGVGLWLIFGIGVAEALGEAAPDRQDLQGLMTTGLIAFVVLLLTGFTAFWLLLAGVGGPAAAGVLYDVTFGLLAMSGVPTAICLGAYAAAVRLTCALPAVTAKIALIGAVAHLGLLASFAVPTGFFSLEGGVILAIPGTLFAWILTTSIALLQRRTDDARTAASGEGRTVAGARPTPRRVAASGHGDQEPTR